MFSLRFIWFGLWRLVFVAIAMTTVLAQASDAPVPVDLSRARLEASSQTFTVLQDVPASWAIEQVVAVPVNRFSAFDPKKTYAVSIDKAIWLHFRVAAGSIQPAEKIVFELPKPYVDEVRFYYKGQDGQWVMQLAGELTARTQWPVRGLYPRFELPPARAAVQDVYVKVLQFVPIRVAPQLKTLNDSNFELQNKLFLYGLVLGLLALMALFSLVLAVSYRRYIYAWYSLYAVFAGLAIASYVGVGNHIFWPNSTVWADKSIILCTAMALAIQLQFCRVMFLHDITSRWVNKAALITLFVSAVCIVGLLFAPLNSMLVRLSFFYVAFASCALMLTVMIGFVAYQRNKVAWLWVLAYAPLLAIVSLTVAEGMGLLPLPDLPYDAVVYSMAFEAIVLMFAMQVHVKAGHQQLVRLATKNELDPLTGFLAPKQFESRFKALWQQAEQNQGDVAVVYVQVSLRTYP